jgi:hypothetical protein
MEDRMRREAEDRRRVTEQAVRSMQASVCMTLASFNLTGALFVADPTTAAKMMDDSLLWQQRAALAHAGIDPMALPTPEGER